MISRFKAMIMNMIFGISYFIGKVILWVVVIALSLLVAWITDNENVDTME